MSDDYPVEEEEFEEPSEDERQPDYGFKSVMTAEELHAEAESSRKEESVYVGGWDAPVDSVLSEQGREELRRPAEVYKPEVQFPAAIPRADIEELSRKASKSYDAQIRMEAALAFMTDPSCGNVPKLLQNPKFSHLNRRTVERWCSLDGWVEKRQRFLAHWAAAAYEKIGSQVAQDRIKELSLIQEIEDRSMEKLRSEDTQAKSFEGVVTALVKLLERKQSIQELVEAAVMPPGHEESPLTGGRSELSDGEMEQLVSGLLAKRRDAIRLAQGIDTTQTDTAAAAEQKALLTEGLPPAAISSEDSPQTTLDLTGLTDAVEDPDIDGPD